MIMKMIPDGRATRSRLGLTGLEILEGELRVPYVNIKITREGVTPEQKAQLIREVTRLLSDLLGKNPQTTVVVIDEVENDNWGIGGDTVTVRRERERTKGVPGQK
jgi:4-oxalocrotonate tautomerase